MPKHTDKDKDVNMTPVEDKENVPPSSKKTIRRPDTFHGRFYKPEIASHSFMQGNSSPKQFFPPNVDKTFYRPLTESQPLTPINNIAPNSAEKQPRSIPKAVTPNGTELVSRRSVKVKMTDSETKENQEGEVRFFSPETRQYDKKRKRSDSNATPKPLGPTETARKALLFSDGPEGLMTEKGGEPTTLKLYERNRKKAKSQKTSMGHTAKEALLDAISNGKEKYEASVLAALRLLAEHVSMEWLHCLAFSLCPKEIDPQDPRNLGSGPDYINTYMMVLERLASFFAKTYPNDTVTVLPSFKMLEGSLVIKEIEYEVTFVKGSKTLQFTNKINALALSDPSNWPSCSDAEQLKWVAEAMVENRILKPLKRWT